MTTATDGAKPVVLVADDDRDILELVAFRLERAGYDVVTANDGAEALELAEDRGPDLAVLDVMMPRLDGHEVTRRQRARYATAPIPVILLGLSRHGHFDMSAYDAYLSGSLEAIEFSEQEMEEALARLPEAPPIACRATGHSCWWPTTRPRSPRWWGSRCGAPAST